MDNRIVKLFEQKQSGVLNVYVTAGYPNLTDTISIIEALDSSGVDIVELGIPYSDPLADGTTIQESSMQALKNGIRLETIFDHVKTIRAKGIQLPIVLMGYFNQMFQFGPERFIQLCASSGVDGLILPDLPMDIYERDYKDLVENHGLSISFLITPHTSDARIRQADRLSKGFLYIVSQSNITGQTGSIRPAQQAYFERIAALEMKHPRLIGFGIHDHRTFSKACEHAHGAIIGSAFIRHLKQHGASAESVAAFIKHIKVGEA